MSRRTRLREELAAILAKDDFEEIFRALQKYSERDLLRHLFSAICRPDGVLRWHAVTVFGWTLNRIADNNLEEARIVMRRLLWSLNDESGGIGWGAPEAMAESMAQNATLFAEYNHMLLSYMREDGPEPFQDGNYIELPQLQRGLVWGIGRLAGIYGEDLKSAGVVGDLIPYLHSPDAEVRGISAWSLGVLGAATIAADLDHLLQDSQDVLLYCKGTLMETTVADLARQAMERMRENTGATRDAGRQCF